MSYPDRNHCRLCNKAFEDQKTYWQDLALINLAKLFDHHTFVWLIMADTEQVNVFRWVRQDSFQKVNLDPEYLQSPWEPTLEICRMK